MIRLALTQGSHRLEWWSSRYDGSELPLDIVMTAVPFGKRTLLSIVYRDISEHKLAESEIRQLNTSLEKRVVVWECGEGVGVLRHEHIGPARDWSAEEIGFVSALASMVSLALEESNRARSEHLLRESEARLRESEERFSTAFRASPALIWLLRLNDGKFVEVNDAFARWLGLDRDRIVGYDTKELDIWLTNAVKYSDPGRVVRFEIGRAGAEVVCTIKDRGIGIPEADLEWLFNAFHRGRNVDERPGTGLGLVIVRRCVDFHSGEIKVESKSGQGTLVTVKLPI